MSECSDRQLVERFLRDREEEAFSSLYDRHTPALFRIAYRLASQDPAEAADIVQETWLRASSGLLAFRWNSTLRTWLCGITVNCCREVQRSNPIRSSSAGEALQDTAPVLEPVLRIDLETAFRSLALGYREVLYLHDVEGMTHVEIGQILGIDEGTSRSQLFKARRRLRQTLTSHSRKGKDDG